MKYAKLIDGEIVFAPNPIKVGGIYIGNPPGLVYEGAGYKPVVYSDKPSDAPSGYYWTESWAEDENIIMQGWVLMEIPITEEEALIRYANELTGAQDETLTEATETLIKTILEVN